MGAAPRRQCKERMRRETGVSSRAHPFNRNRNLLEAAATRVLDRHLARRLMKRAAGARGWLRRGRTSGWEKGQNAGFPSRTPHHLSEGAKFAIDARRPKALQSVGLVENPK
jgi:hypothetical protein